MSSRELNRYKVNINPPSVGKNLCSSVKIRVPKWNKMDRKPILAQMWDTDKHGFARIEYLGPPGGGRESLPL